MEQHPYTRSHREGEKRGKDSISSSEGWLVQNVMASCSAAAEGNNKNNKDSKGMPAWRPPAALGEGGLTELWDRLYPLKLYNSLTRTKVMCVDDCV